jgi:hypothetical protein
MLPLNLRSMGRRLDAPNNKVSGSPSSTIVGCMALNTSLSTCACSVESAGDIDAASVNFCDVRMGDDPPCIRDSKSMTSSFSSKRRFSSLTSASSDLTCSSRDSVYPRGKALRLSLSLVLHSNPTFKHCVQVLVRLAIEPYAEFRHTA